MRGNNQQIKRGIKALIEGMLEDYPKYYRHVQNREFELANPVAPLDENVGGGKAVNRYINPVDRFMITTESDKRLTDLEANHRDIRVCYEEANENIKTICELIYFKNPRERRYHTIEALVNDKKISISKSEAYREWNDFIEEIAEQLHLDRFM